MKALTFEGKHQLSWRDATAPRIEGDRQAIVRPIASTTCDLDQRIISGWSPFAPPFEIGHECVAEVVEVGEAVRGVKAGDIVVMPMRPFCGRCRRCAAGLTSFCVQYENSFYGVPLGVRLGGLFSDLVSVPEADAMLIPIGDDVDPVALASAGDNLTDAYIGVKLALARHPGAPVFVYGGVGSLGCYAVEHALAAGASRVDYVDPDPIRRAVAQDLGAVVHEVFEERFVRSFPAALCVSRNAAQLRETFTALEPGGHLHCLAIYFQDTAIPMFELYNRGVTISVGKPNISAHLPEVIELCRCGKIHPKRVFSRVVKWEDAPDALVEPSLKPVVVRQPIYSKRRLDLRLPSDSVSAAQVGYSVQPPS